MLVFWILGGVVVLIVIRLVYEQWRYRRHSHSSFYCVSRVTADGEPIRYQMRLPKTDEPLGVVRRGTAPNLPGGPF